MATGPFLLAVIGSFATMAVVTIALRPALAATPGPSFASVVQGGVRWNGMIPLAVATPLFGPEGAALAALMLAPSVPLVNVVCVAALSRWGEGASPTLRVFLARLATNPLILASLAGGLWNIADLPLTGPVASALGLLTGAAIPLSLLNIGAGLDLTSIRGQRIALGVAVALKLLLAPLVMWGWAIALDLSPLATAVLVTGGAAPGAAASYVLARELGGDAPLTAAHVTSTTALATLTLPMWALIVMSAVGLAQP